MYRHPIALRHSVLLVVAVVLLVLSPGSADAFDMRTGESTVVDAGTPLNDDLYAFGTTVDVRGTINGDVNASGSAATLSGTVNGEVIAAGG